MSALVNRIKTRWEIIKMHLELKYYTLLYTDDRVNNIFDGKKVAIVGPADSAFNTGLGQYIDDFDVVVRINKCPQLMLNPDFLKDIGTRTDVLVHCLNEERSGVLDFELYQKQQLKHIISFAREGEWRVFKLNNWLLSFLKNKRKFLKSKLYMVSKEDYRDVNRLLNLHDERPTTGFLAIYAVLQSNFDKLYITGMTFFQTNYVDSYRDVIKTPELSREKFNKVKSHDPDNEFKLFKKLIADKRDRVILDAFLTKVID